MTRTAGAGLRSLGLVLALAACGTQSDQGAATAAGAMAAAPGMAAGMAATGPAPFAEAAARDAASNAATPAPTAEATNPDLRQAAALVGSRPDRIAQVLRNIVVANRARDWQSVLAAFPGAAWEARESHAPGWGGNTTTATGTIDLGGAVYKIGVGGTADRVNHVQLSSPGDDLVEWSLIETALRAHGVQPRNVGCHSPTGFGYVRLRVGATSAILHKFVNYGSAVPSTDEYTFAFDDPFDGRTETQVARDRSLCH